MEDEEEAVQQCNTFTIYHRRKSRNPTSISADFVMERLKPFVTMVVIQSVYTVMNVLYKLAEDDGMNLRILIAYRLVFATVFVTPLAVILERKKWPKLTWAVLFQGFLSGLFGASLSQTLYAESLALTSATFAAAISNLAPAITLLFAVLFRLESLSLKTGVGKAKVAGTMIGVIGATVLTFYKGVGFKSLSTNIQLLKPSHGNQNVQHQITGSHSFLGLLTGLGSCISYAIWLIMQSKIGKTYQCCHYSSTALMSMMASIQSVCFCMFVEKDWSQWKLGLNVRLLAVSFAGIVASGLAMIAIVRIVEIRGPVLTSAFNPLSLVFVAIISSLMLDEQLYLGSLIGGILIVCGLYLVLWGKVKEFELDLEPKPDDLEKNNRAVIVVHGESTSPARSVISDGDLQFVTGHHMENRG
ncbi:WAT1-related protein At1g25270 [Linum perenne]